MVVEGVSSDGLVLSVGVPTCSDEVHVVVVEEAAEKVVLSATADRSLGFGGNEECASVEEVSLNEPLGDRKVFDDHTGEEVVVYNTEPGA